MAGLAGYAYRTLGWRRAAIVFANWDAGWDARDAFAAEFCALGGRVTSQVGVELFDPSGGDVDKVPADVDGVAVFAAPLLRPGGVPQAAAPGAWAIRRAGSSSGPASWAPRPCCGRVGSPLHGATGSTYDRPALMRAYLRRYAEAFPGDVARRGQRRAGDRVPRCRGGDRARARARRRGPRAAARRAGAPAPGAPRRATFASTRTARPWRRPRSYGSPARAASSRLGELPAVDQSIGGLLPASLSPDSRPVACRSRA